MNGRDVLVDDDSATPSGSITPVHDVSINETPLSLRRETSLTLHRETSLTLHRETSLTLHRETSQTLHRDMSPKTPELSPEDIEAKVPSNFAANKCSSNPRFQDQVTLF